MPEYKVSLLPHQDELYGYIMDTPEVKEAVLMTGIGGGKTYLGGILTAVLSTKFKCPGMVCANTYGQLMDSTITEASKAWDDMGVRWQVKQTQKQTYLYLDGKKHYLRSLDKFENIRGSGVGWAWLDEGFFAHFEAYKVVLGRIRDDRGPLKAFITTTGQGKNWGYEYFLEDPQADEKKDKSRKIVYNVNTADNIHLPDSYVETLKNSYSGRYKDQELGGQFVSMSGGVYDIENNIAEYTPDMRLGYEFAIDFGRRRPAWWVSQEYEVNRDIVFDAFFPEDILIDDLCLKVKDAGYTEPITIYVDPAGDSGNTHTYETDISIVKKHFPGARIKYTRRPSLVRIETKVTILSNRIDKGYLLFSSTLRKKKPGDYNTVIRSFQGLCYPDDKSGKAIKNHPVKDGLNDHATDCGAYFVINKYPILDNKLVAL